MRIEPFDPFDEATAPAYAALLAETRECVTPVGLPMPEAYVLNRLRHNGANYRSAIWLAHDGAAVVGSAEVTWREAPDNRDRAWVHLDVPLRHAIRPLLDALGAVAAEHLRANGRHVMVCEVEDGSPHAAWVSDRGGRFGSYDQHNVLRLAGVSRADVAALAAAIPDGYELLSWDDPAPDDVLAPYVTLMSAINDAPTDDLTTEPEVFSAERLRDWEAAYAARGHALWTVVARHTASGELAGHTQLEVRPEWPEVVTNQDTAVAVAHRGHGLGLWLKAVNLLRVLDTLPDAVCIDTWNAASNAHMLRVNHRLGFRREHVVAAWEIDAADVLNGAKV